MKVEQGDKVEAGQLLMKINLPFIRKHHPATVMVILEKQTSLKLHVQGINKFGQAGDY